MYLKLNNTSLVIYKSFFLLKSVTSSNISNLIKHVCNVAVNQHVKSVFKYTSIQMMLNDTTGCSPDSKLTFMLVIISIAKRI